MSKRKRYRKLRNNAVKNNLAAFSANRRKHREEREAADAREQLGRARLLYDTFKKAMCEDGVALSAPQVIARIEALKDAMRKVVKNKHTLKTLIDEIIFNEVKFLVAFGPKSEAQKAQWRAEAKALRVSNRKSPEEPVDPARN